MAGPRRAVFFDRDGVLCVSHVRDGRPYAPTSVSDFVIYDEAAPALDRLKQAGFVLIVVTNQPDVVRGLMRREDLDTCHDILRDALPVDDIRTCLCLEDDPDCDCYKPRPGMLMDAAGEWGVDLAASFMVGDRWRDVGAGKNAGCATVLIDRGYSEKLRDTPDMTVASLTEAVDAILG